MSVQFDLTQNLTNLTAPSMGLSGESRVRSVIPPGDSLVVLR